MKKINELEDGFRGDITVLLTGVNRGVTAKGAAYLSLMFQDNTGLMDAKYWNVSEPLLNAYKAGMLVKASGDVLIHQKHLQFRVNKLEVVDASLYDMNEFVRSGSIEKEELKKQVYEKLHEIQNEVLYTITKTILKEFDKNFFEYPAASKNHHDFVGGLATHVLGMLKTAEQLCCIYPLLNRDLLYSGVILHDIGKTVELSGAVVTEYTTEGKLLGHISIMQAKISEVAKELGYDGEEIILLRHMVLSHHGNYEYGSPVLPMIPEAEILYMIDNIDARMNTMEKALQAVEPGCFTPRIFALENRSFYKSTLRAEEKKL